MAVDGPLADDLAIVGRERAADLDGDTPLRAVQLPAPEVLVALADGDATVSMKIIQGGNADGAGVFDRRWQPLVGIPGGACMGLLGVGGGLLATPIFTQVFGQRQTVAQSLSLVLVTPCSAVALLTYGRAHQVDWSIGLPMAIGGLLTVSAGVAVAHRLPERSMRLAFAWMILATALWMLLKPLILQGPW